MLGGEAGVKPGGELGLAARRDGVDALLRTAVLLYPLLRDQSGVLQACEGGIDLGGAHVPQLLAAGQGDEGAMQLITVARAQGEQSQERVADRHKLLTC